MSRSEQAVKDKNIEEEQAGQIRKRSEREKAKAADLVAAETKGNMKEDEEEEGLGDQQWDDRAGADPEQGSGEDQERR